MRGIFYDIEGHVRTALKKPYRVQGWNEQDILDITERACIPFRIGAYEDVLWFDIVPKMECHLILGRTWQMEKRTVHCGKDNTYTFRHKG